MGSFGLFFASVPDPRASNSQHVLSELLFIAFAAVLCGAQCCQDMADFGVAREASLRNFLQLEHGVPSHDTFSRVFRLLDPLAFEASFRRFMAAFAAKLNGQVGTAGQVVALDGKSLSCAFEAGARTTPFHLVTAWGAENRLVFGQRPAPGRNEVEGALQLVATLDLDGAIVTADALHGNRKMAAAIRAREGDYVLALKGNRGPLYHATKALLEGAPVLAHGEPETTHGRVETRQAVVLPVPEDWAKRFEFEDLAAVARIDTIRRCGATEERQSRYFVLSRMLPADRVQSIVRAHWGIENRQHWVLDVIFDEDHARARKDNAAHNLALLRRLVLNLLQSVNDKFSIRRRIKRAAWDETYFFSLLGHMR
jgi:predicted transposase YbfD/YdcC